MRLGHAGSHGQQATEPRFKPGSISGVTVPLDRELGHAASYLRGGGRVKKKKKNPEGQLHHR